MKNVPIVVAYGDGIGPEIMKATLAILKAAGASLDIATIEIGKEIYLRGISTGMSPESLQLLQERGVFLKAPITTPQGGGFKSLNVTTRRALGLYANVRPCRSYHPYVATKHPQVDMVIVRENEEDLYSGIEYRQSAQVVTATKLISRLGCEKIIRYAFEYARRYQRKKVSCFTKDNIMKMTDGLFHQVFKEIGEEYPELEQEHWIVDIATAKVADTPERFDVIVAPNLYGDIISDVAAEVTGSVGLAGSANIGEGAAMFEAIHGSAPDIAGKGIANPSGLLLASVMMLLHIQQPEVATIIHNAWLRTLEEGIHTADIFDLHQSRLCATTEEFTSAVIAQLGKQPEKLPPVEYHVSDASGLPPIALEEKEVVLETAIQKKLVGVDFWCDATEEDKTAQEMLADLLSQWELMEQEIKELLFLKMIDNRGMVIWPNGVANLACCGLFRVRFLLKESVKKNINPSLIVRLLEGFVLRGIPFVKVEMLYFFDDQPGFSLAQGE